MNTLGALKEDLYRQEDIADFFSQDLSVFDKKDLPLWLRRDSDLSKNERKLVRDYLESLSDDVIIELYHKMREIKVLQDGTNYYPNIQVLFATPFEREKDRREQKLFNSQTNEIIEWYKTAKEKSCVWWLENHIISRHAFSSCMSCGSCTALCPAAEFYDFSPRAIMDVVQTKDEEAIVELLKADELWYCHQCASCKTKCPRNNSPFAMISSLRQLSQLKGYHINSIRGRQQYAGLHLWGGNLWNRACTVYFRNPAAESHRDFGPRYEQFSNAREEYFKRIGACPDTEGILSGRKVHPETLHEVRKIWQAAGALYFWELIEDAAQKHAETLGLTVDEYHDKVKSEG
jgi:heterodisulfide reductase subunit C